MTPASLKEIEDNAASEDCNVTDMICDHIPELVAEVRRLWAIANEDAPCEKCEFAIAKGPA